MLTPPSKQQTIFGYKLQVLVTLNGQLSEQLHIERNNAHTLCIYLNRLLGNPEALQIKALVFPN